MRRTARFRERRRSPVEEAQDNIFNLESLPYQEPLQSAFFRFPTISAVDDRFHKHLYLLQERCLLESALDEALPSVVFLACFACSLFVS